MEPGRPMMETYSCEATTGCRKALPVRRCARLEDDRRTGLCEKHCHDVFGVERMPYGWRKSAPDEAMIEAMIRSVRDNQ